MGGKEDLGTFIENHVEGDWSKKWDRKVGSKGYMDVRAAITAIREEHTLSSVLKRCIDFSGDVDTVATIAMAAASCCDEIEKDLPEILIRNMEDREYGRSYLIDLDNKLRQKFI